MEKEIWKNIPNFEGKYKASNLGNVKSLITNKIMSGKSLRGGYRSVWLIDKCYKIHRLVALTFLKNDDKTKNVVNHIDGNKLNNNVKNLEWVTTAENTKHGYTVGKNKVTKRAVKMIGKFTGNIIYTFESLQLARIVTGISDSSIANVCKGKMLYAGGYKWEFADKNLNETIIDFTGMKEIKNFPNYKIRKDGVIYSIRFKKILKQQINSDGYKVISLANNNKKGTFLVHRLVAEHFINKVDNKNLVNHKDGDKLNCDVSNLEWVNNSENVIHGNNMRKNKKL